MAEEGPDRATLLEVYRLALVTRAMDERLWAFARQGRAGFVLTGRGLTPDAPACCPDLNVRRVYAFNGGRFTLVDSTDTPG